MALTVRRKNLIPVQFSALDTGGALTVWPLPFLASALALGATKAMIHFENKPVRVRDDGVNPVGAVGILYPGGGDPFLYEGNLSSFKFRNSLADTLVKVAYYR